MSEEPKKLIEIQSIHEQREEPGNLVKLENGVWIEISDFDSETEQVTIQERLEIIDVQEEKKDDKIYYTFICKKLNIIDDFKIKEELANKIVDKHNLILKASFAKCLVDGIDSKSVSHLKRILYKLGGDVDDKQENS